MTIHESANGVPLLQVQDLCFRHPGSEEQVLKSLSFNIPAGVSTAIIGVSGRGKSTLLRLLAGLEQPQSGVVLWKGQLLSRPTREIGIVFQNYSETVFDWLTVEQNIRLAQRERATGLAGVQEIATRLGIEDKLYKSAKKLSGGERQRVAIARALIQRAEVVLLDEPFSSLDTLARHDLIRTLRTITDIYNTTFVVVSHDIEEAITATRRVLCLLRSSENPQVVLIDWSDNQLRGSSELVHVYAVIRQKAEQILHILREDREHEDALTTAVTDVKVDQILETLSQDKR